MVQKENFGREKGICGKKKMLACAIGSLPTIQAKTTVPHMDFEDLPAPKATKPHAFLHKTASATSKVDPSSRC